MMNLNMDSFLPHIKKFEKNEKKVNFFQPRTGSNLLRIISGPVEKLSRYSEKEFMRYHMVIIDRTSNKVCIFVAGKGVLNQLVRCIQTNGDLLNYDVNMYRENTYRFPTINVIPSKSIPLSDEDLSLIEAADIPDEFKVKVPTIVQQPNFSSLYDNLIKLGAQFRVSDKQILLTANGTAKWFGDKYHPCQIQYVDDDVVIIGREDWAFKVPVSREMAREKFAKKLWLPVKTLINPKAGEPVWCARHRTLTPKGFACCATQLLTPDSNRVIF